MAILEYAAPRVQVNDIVELTRLDAKGGAEPVYYIVATKPILFGTDEPGKRYSIVQPQLLQYAGPNHWRYAGSLLFDAQVAIGPTVFTVHRIAAVSEEQARRIAIGEVARKYNLIPSAANALVHKPGNLIRITFHS